jgi:hypothetical protein
MQFAVSSQTRNKFYFPVGPEDAHVLSRHMPQLTAHDLARLDDFTALVQVHANGKDQPAFTLAARPPAEPVGKADQVRAEAAAHLRPVPPRTTKDEGAGENDRPTSPGKSKGKSSASDAQDEAPSDIPPDKPGQRRN